MHVLRSIVVLASLACIDSTAPEPGRVLVGSWNSTTDAIAFPLTLDAGHAGATLLTACWRAQFPAVHLSDSLTFSDTGVVTEAGGLISIRVGDPYVITGRAIGHDLVVNQQLFIPGTRRFQVCTA